MRRRRASAARWALAVGGLLLLLGCLLLGRAAPRQALLSYLSAFIFFTGLSVGSLALLMVHELTGGSWGRYLQPPLLAAAGALPLQALLAVPLLIGVPLLYPWADAAAVLHDARLRAQSWYLDVPFFIARTLVCFGLWLALCAALRRRLTGRAAAGRTVRLAAAGLILYALSTLVVATDWVMSLTPHWHSSSFGLMVATGWMLAAAALAVLRAAGTTRGDEPPPAAVLHDLGNLLLMFVLAWSYLAFMQYLTVWIADQPAETAWYLPRTSTSWRTLAWFLIAFHFAVPFAVLLSRRVKRARLPLTAIAGLLLIASAAEALWLTLPDLRTGAFALRWTDLLAGAGMGLLWLAVYVRGPGASLDVRAGSAALGAAHG